MKRRRTDHFRAKRKNFNTELREVYDRFPTEAFDEYFKADKITVPFAIFSELLNILRTERIYVNARNERPLNSAEVKQIAGRAERYGIYDTGYVTSYYDYDTIEGLLFSRLVPLRQVMINIPEDFLHKDGRVSEILETWNRIPAEKYYNKGDISEKIAVARALEKIRDNRKLIRKFIRIPIDDGNKDTFGVYLDYYDILVNGSYPDINRTMAEYSSETVDEDDKKQRL